MAPSAKRQKLNIDSNYLKEQTLIDEKFVAGLATLQDAVQTLSTSYIRLTNAVLGEHGTNVDIDGALARLSDNPLLAPGLQNIARAPGAPVVAASEAGEKKSERKKRQHDPNAPKRPLTPFFLYMQTARPIIAGDLGPDVAKGAVSSEGTRRWGTMAPDDKQVRSPTPRSYTTNSPSSGPMPTRITSGSTTHAYTHTSAATTSMLRI